MRNLILLQENSGQVSFLNSIPDANLRNLVRTTIDGLAENFESIKTTLQVKGYYDRIINLTNTNCTKAKLLQAMIDQTRNGNTFDLLVLGHGGPNELCLHGNERMTGQDIRNLLVQARAHYAGLNFKLRMVYMCNCNSGTLLDDWLHIGAKVALGSDGLNYMPEPQITFFFEDFVKKNYNVRDANNRSFNASNTIWSPVLDNTLRQGSKLRVAGDSSIRFEGRRLTVGETVTRNIYAGNAYNYTNLFMIAGEKYKFTVPADDKWKNSANETNANGYPRGFLDFPRQPGQRMMKLVGEIFSDNGNNLSYTGINFGIGTSKTWDVSLTGYLVGHANDNLIAYGDNTGQIQVTIKRLS